MWEIYEHNRILKIIKKLPEEILKRYEKWKDVISISGPQGLKVIAGFCDEALKGKWMGYISLWLNEQYLVIYTVNKNEIYVRVEEITPHDYRRQQ
jgi:mRNA-degrading endonuclease YafQ of YafQ-DinJ toxin-antitoxin module